VVVHEDHSAPVAAVSMTHRVGSTHEPPGRTGFAHLFEHLMFTGSKHAPGDSFSRSLTPLGDRTNAQTTEDRTSYEALVPSNGVETLLWLESDRMGFLLDDVDQADLDRQRDVVRNERRQLYDNRVFGTRDEVVRQALYPTGHPYSWPVIGSMADLSAATLADVRAFFRQHYAPATRRSSSPATWTRPRCAGSWGATSATSPRALGRDARSPASKAARGAAPRPHGWPRAAPGAHAHLADSRRPGTPTVRRSTWSPACSRRIGRVACGRLLVHERQLATTVRVGHDP
jgi:hypothetical protein